MIYVEQYPPFSISCVHLHYEIASLMSQIYKYKLKKKIKNYLFYDYHKYWSVIQLIQLNILMILIVLKVVLNNIKNKILIFKRVLKYNNY